MNLKKQDQVGKQQKNFKLSEAISLLQRKHYGCLSRIFCCKCFYCCQVHFDFKKDFDFSLLTSKNRKGAFEQMVKKYLKSMHSNSSHTKGNIIMDPFFILVALLLGQQSQIYNELLQQVSNANQATIFSKQDLQFYIPQLCTYLVFHQEMSNIQLSTLLQRACKIDLHFSLRYYFFMKSLQMIDSTFEVRKLPIVEKYNAGFRKKINAYHKMKFKVKNQRKISDDLSKVDAYSDESKEHDHGLDNSTNDFKVNEKKIQMQQQSTNHESQMPRQGQKYRKSSFSSSSSGQTSYIQEMNSHELQICKQYNAKGNQYMQILDKFHSLSLNELYEPFIMKMQNSSNGLFESTANFFIDLICLSQVLLKAEDRGKQFQNYLGQINSRLPAVVYIPFTKSILICYHLFLDQYQGLNILNIVIKESRVFKTKERAPFKICFQTFYNPNSNDQSSRQKKIRSTYHSSKNLKRSMLFEQDILLNVDGQTTGQEKISSQMLQNRPQSQSTNAQKQVRDLRDSSQSGIHMTQQQKKQKINFKQLKKNIWDKLFQLKKLIKQENSTDKKTERQNNKTINSSIQKNTTKMQQQNVTQNQSSFVQNQSHKTQKQQRTIINEDKTFDCRQDMMTEDVLATEEKIHGMFGIQQHQRLAAIAERSPYSRLPGYRIVNLMVKSNDDLRQECFAMQLLSEFQRIFIMEKLKIKLCPYQVMPLNHNSGIIEFVSQAITIDQLIKKQGNLLFVRKSPERLKNFIQSLAGYSLVTYMLQVKDRHNQNIMIKRDGTILHIDYGFFLSNMPGKGVQLQKKVPFKLTQQYIDALGGLKSKQFAYFRKLFYQGFNALRKHQHRILILTKLMYSSYGTTMKCFQKGDEAIDKLVKRFNPKNVRTDGELSLFCQNLVNDSIQNWRAKWYDRWQYFAQGILY